MNAGPLKRFNVHTKKSHGMISGLLLTTVYQTVKTMTTALNSMQRLGREVHGMVFGLPSEEIGSA